MQDIDELSARFGCLLAIMSVLEDQDSIGASSTSRVSGIKSDRDDLPQAALFLAEFAAPATLSPPRTPAMAGTSTPSFGSIVFDDAPNAERFNPSPVAHAVPRPTYIPAIPAPSSPSDASSCTKRWSLSGSHVPLPCRNYVRRAAHDGAYRSKRLSAACPERRAQRPMHTLTSPAALRGNSTAGSHLNS